MEMEYYHDIKMQKLFQVLEEPKSLDEIDLSRGFIQNLLLKIINTYGNIKVQQMHEITGLHTDLLEECLKPMENRT
jgi:hypothetical protein